MKQFLLSALVLLGLFSLEGCKTSTKSVMKFEINPDLLGSTKNDTVLWISYAAPAEFAPSAEEESIKQQGEMRNEGVKILTVYQDNRSQAFMIVSSLTENLWHEFKNQVDKPQKGMSSNVWQTMNATAFEYNTFSVQQWLLQNTSWINFKLMYQSKNKNYFQVDYLIPVAFYDEHIAKAIESSIGSFKSL